MFYSNYIHNSALYKYNSLVLWDYIMHQTQTNLVQLSSLIAHDFYRTHLNIYMNSFNNPLLLSKTSRPTLNRMEIYLNTNCSKSGQTGYVFRFIQWQSFNN